MAFALTIIKAVLEIAGMALIAQFLVGVFAWGRRQQNPVYRLLEVITSPVTRFVRWVTPRFVLDRHVPLVALLFVSFLWVFVLFELAGSCHAEPQQRACAAVTVNR